MEGVTCTAVLLYVRLAVILGLHALFVVLALARALSADTTDGAWNWYVVFAPLFVFDLLSVVYWVLYLVSYVAVKLDDDSLWSGRYSSLFPGQKFSLLLVIAYGVGIPLKVTAEILLLLHLQDVSTIRLFVPAVLLMLLFLGVGVLAVGESMAPMVNLWIHSGDFHTNICHRCLGQINRYFRRCLYHVCIACTN